MKMRLIGLPLWAWIMAYAFNSAQADSTLLDNQLYGDQLVLKFDPKVPMIQVKHLEKKNVSLIRWRSRAKKSLKRKYTLQGSKYDVTQMVVSIDATKGNGSVYIWHQHPDDFQILEYKDKIVVKLLRKSEARGREMASLVDSKVDLKEDVQENKISLFLKDAEIPKVIRALAKEAGKNVVFGEEVLGRVSVNLKNVNFQEAVETILRPTKYRADFGPKVTIIKPRGEALGLRSFQWRYVDVNSVLETVKGVLTTAQISIDSHTNTMFVKATPQDLDAIARLMVSLDVPPKQVEVEAAIVQLNKTNDLKYGFDWSGPLKHIEANNSFNQRLSTLDTEISQGLFVGLSWRSVTGIMSMFEASGNATILARPRIVALNDETADIIIGDRIGYRTTTTTGQTTVENISFLTVGTQLEIKPHITENLDILMTLKPEVSTGALDATTNLPNESTTSSSTKILSKNGQTIVIGGLLRDQKEEVENKVPVLGDIPLLGLFFRGTTEKVTKNEIMILLSPKIIDLEMREKSHREGESVIRRLYDSEFGYEEPGMNLGKNKN